MGCVTLKFRYRIVILYFDGLLGVVSGEQALGSLGSGDHIQTSFSEDEGFVVGNDELLKR